MSAVSELTKHDNWRAGPRQNSNDTLKPEELPNIRDVESLLGSEWTGIFETDVEFNNDHFIKAMTNLIDNPNINSTVILRADILRDRKFQLKTNIDENERKNGNVECKDEDNENETYELVKDFTSDNLDKDVIINEIESDDQILMRGINDIELRYVPVPKNFKPLVEVVRRVIPRNPSKDYIINQSCMIMRNSKDKSTLVLYTPHISTAEEIPFYLPPSKSIGILFNENNSKLSIHYLPFDNQNIDVFKKLEPAERPIRIAYRLLNTSKKHSNGVMTGYQKRVNHDRVVDKQSFQDRYIALKQKYAKNLVDNWSEKTDPRKHVFEDIAIAAFLIELWKKIYTSQNEFEFRDLGCGNGILAYILMMEGYKGEGIDARERKSWSDYPEHIRLNLKEQVVIPSALLRPHPLMLTQNPYLVDNGQEWKVPIHLKPQHQGTNKTNNKNVQVVECYTSNQLLNDEKVCITEFPPNTFIIGNHSDELTCWIPLLGYPFMVIPCCSHNLNGEKARYQVLKQNKTNGGEKGNSRYQGLVDHVEMLASLCGWKVEREMLRIPSTRNAAVISYQPSQMIGRSIYEIMAMEGGASRWVENTLCLMKRPPRDH